MSNSPGNKNNRNRRRNRRKNKNRRKGPKNKQVAKAPKFIENEFVEPAGEYEGVLEIDESGYGFLRKLNFEFSKTEFDPFVSKEEIVYKNLRPGLMIAAELEQDQEGNRRARQILSINGGGLEEWANARKFEHQKPIMPVDQIRLGYGAKEHELRIIDLIAPLGKGQRSLIVAPPRTGKTVLLHLIADAVAKHHPDIELAVLLVDERPEEVTDFVRSTQGKVFASSNDRNTESHVRISELALGYVKRQAELGKDVVLLIDSLTRLGRAYNAAQKNSGRTMSGGLDIRALEIPKKIFGSARKIEEGGSLTIVATCLVETNSRMDDLIFEEFKGTGNMEIVLDRELANNRVYPAINISASGTRNEDKFIEDSLEERNMVRRYLLKKSPMESMTSLLQVIKRTESNQEILDQIAAYS